MESKVLITLADYETICTLTEIDGLTVQQYVQRAVERQIHTDLRDLATQVMKGKQNDAT